MRFGDLIRRASAPFQNRRLRFGTKSLAICTIAVVLAIAVNLAVGAIPVRRTRIDTTPMGIYTLSQQTEQIVKALDEDVTLYWIVSDSYEDIYLEELLRFYDDLSRHVDVVKLDPVENPAALERLVDDPEGASQIEDNSVVVVCGERRKLLNNRYDIYTYSDYSSYYQYYYYYGTEMLDSFCAERSITGAIAYVTSDELPVLYMLSGHGEEDLTAVYSEIEHENIRIQPLDLDLVGAVPADCACLMLASPRRDISEMERRAISDYIAAGGRMLLITTYAEHDVHKNLLAMMSEEFGVELEEGVVFENDAASHYVGFPGYLYPEIMSHEITDPLIAAGYRIMLPNAQGLTISGSPPVGVYAQSLAQTSDKSYSQTEVNELYERRDSDVDGPFELAVAVSTDDGGQIVWITSVYLFDTMVNEMSGGANMDLFLNSLSWMCEHEANVGVREIPLAYEYLAIDGAASTALAAVLIGAIPLVFIAEGVITVILRRRRSSV